MQTANHHIVVTIDLKICVHKWPIDRNEMNERMLQTILKWKVEEALQKRRKKPKTLLIANIGWRHSIKFSFISMLSQSWTSFYNDQVQMKPMKPCNNKWSTVQYSIENNVSLEYIYFEAHSEFICFSHNLYSNKLTMSKLKEEKELNI